MPEPLLNVDDYARAAEARLDPGVFGYVVGGADDEWTLRENRAAFRRWEEVVPVRFDLNADSGNAEVHFAWKIQFDIAWDPNGEIQEYICQENNRWQESLMESLKK